MVSLPLPALITLRAQPKLPCYAGYRICYNISTKESFFVWKFILIEKIAHSQQTKEMICYHYKKSSCEIVNIIIVNKNIWT